MNLYTQSLADYIKDEWDRALSEPNGSREARFIVESMDPESVFSLFQALDAHRLTSIQQRNIKCYFRVAKDLWGAWCDAPSSEAEVDRMMDEAGAPRGPAGERSWIDEENRLTWYRNRTVRDEGVDGLVVVLVGLNHATDQGGLADFHRVDEARIWTQMGESFISWIEQIDKQLDMQAINTEFDKLDTVFQKLFQVRPLSLGKLAEYLEHKVIAGGEFFSIADFTNRFFEQLSFWEIPPLLAGDETGDLRGKKGAERLEEAATFISHRRYKTPAERKKAWEKIEDALDAADFELPLTVGNDAAFTDSSDYRETLHAFIHNADAGARRRLLQTDILPLLRILKKTKSSRKTSKSIRTLSGMSFEVLLEGIWETLVNFTGDYSGQSLGDRLAGIHVELLHFTHDLTADEGEDGGAQELARGLLQGCLGGLEEIFEQIDCRLPRDVDQSRLPRDRWDLKVPITLDLALSKIGYGTGRTRPRVQFKVTISNADPNSQPTESVFNWVLDSTQPERVRFECARNVLNSWSAHPNPERLLPAFEIRSVAMTALYYAADSDEANRLITQAMTELKLDDLLAGLSPDQMDSSLWQSTIDLIDTYREWLQVAISEGDYAASTKQMHLLTTAFIELAKSVLDTELLGSAELLRRIYKAFLVVDERTEANDPYLPGAIAWGLSPAVLELTHAKTRFLTDGFPEVIGDIALGGGGKAVFKRLLDLAQIHRPLAALVVDTQQLSATIKSFGLLHYLGPEPPAGKSLAVQTLLREDGGDDEEEVRETTRPCEERDLVVRVLRDYQGLYPFAADGLRILAVNVRELQTILSGLDFFLREYLKTTSADWPAFHCTVMVYSTSSSPMAVENQLALWRDHAIELHQEKGRPLILSVGHRYAPKDQIVELLNQEQRHYDIAFLFHFLRGSLKGRADAAPLFEYDFSKSHGLAFPITEYPRPIEYGNRYRRQSLISNRRLQIQTHHADLSERLLHGDTRTEAHLIFGQVDYKPWIREVEALHERAQWVVCVDPFVDKRLLCSEDGSEQRKIVGFESGLGAYGEINLTISTEQDTLKQLTDRVSSRLAKLMPFENTAGFEVMAIRVVGEAEEVIGLSSLRAVVGDDERIREVVGFAAIRRALSFPNGQMPQLFPLDSALHWFVGSDGPHRPDLLQLTLEVRPNDVPLVHAVLVECKLAQKNRDHITKAIDQIREGLKHLTGLLAPSHSGLRRPGFDRRYWWAQLHRAMTSRAVVKLPEQKWRELDHALECLAGGEFEIRWRGVLFTFWTNEPRPQLQETLLPLPSDIVPPPFEVPLDFVIHHVELGYEGLSALFSEATSSPLIELKGPEIRLRPEKANSRAFTEPPSVPGDGGGPVAEARSPVGPSKIEEKRSPAATPEKVQTRVPPLTQPHRAHYEDGTKKETQETEAAPPAPKAPEIRSPEPITRPRPLASTSPASSATGDSLVIDASGQVPEKILIGTRNNDAPVYWHFGHSQLPNRHLLLFGASGSGKTYGIQCLLAEMAEQQLHSLIVDYTDGFLPTQVEPRFTEIARTQNLYVREDGLPLNPFRKQSQVIDPARPPVTESPFEVASRVASIFATVFSTMGDQQLGTLTRVLEDGVESESAFSLEKMLASLEAKDSKYGDSLVNKLLPLVKSKPFRQRDESAWEEMLRSPDHWVNVLQLTKLASTIQKMVTEFVLWDLWDYVQNSGSKNRPIPIVLDEIQNLDHSSDSPIDKMLREGRKFGLSLILATQTISQFNKEQQDRLFQAGHKLFFKPATTEVERFARILSQSKTGVSTSEWVQRLGNLEKGQCWSLGPVLQSGGSFREEAVLVNVTSLEQRRFEI